MIKVFEDKGQQLVDARELHGFLEGSDYVVLESSPELANVLHAKKDYALTLDMAKELAMLERNEKGKEARKCLDSPRIEIFCHFILLCGKPASYDRR